jgi:nitroreductase
MGERGERMSTASETWVGSEATIVLEAIRSRRSIGKVDTERPSRETIARLIEAARWAPNHHLTEPWRFFVLTGQARRDLGEAMARAQHGDPASDEALAAFERTANKPLRAPVVIAVAVQPSPDARIPEVEELAAGAAAVQNLLLAAHALGLGAIWRTGEPCYHPTIRTFFGLDERARLLGFVYLGYPVAAPPARERTPVEDLTTWLGWEDEATVAAD